MLGHNPVVKARLETIQVASTKLVDVTDRAIDDPANLCSHIESIRSLVVDLDLLVKRLEGK